MKCLKTEEVMRWRLILEEFSLEVIYMKGSKIIVADDLSRLYKIDNQNNKVGPTLESLIENFALHNEDVQLSWEFNRRIIL